MGGDRTASFGWPPVRRRSCRGSTAAIHLDRSLEEGTEITLDIEDLGSFSGCVVGPHRDGLVPIKFDMDEEAKDRLIAKIMKIYDRMNWNDKDN